MNTRTVDPWTIWAVLTMEAGLALPLVSLPAQGDRTPGLLGPLLLVAMLPVGYVAVHRLAALRDPSWRLLFGIGIALLTRAGVASVPEPGLPGLAIWLGRSVVPSAIGIGLWWRGGGLDAAELTAADVRTEFCVLAVCMLAALAMVRPFLLPDPLLLGVSVGLFAAGGLVGTAMSRQDAAEAGSFRFGRTLAATTALLPAAAAVGVVGMLRPALLGSMWSTLARAIELALIPIGWLLAWLASLFPKVAPAPGPPLPLPPVRRLTDLEQLAQAQDRPEWIGMLVAVVLLLATSVLVLLIVRLMLANWINPAPRLGQPKQPELRVERSGAPGQDVHAFLGWLMRWLRGQLRSRRVGQPAARQVDVASAVDAWMAYRRLLEWAERQGIARRPAETTGELQARLARHAPESAETVELVTSTYEHERYGAVHPPADRLRRVQAALGTLLGH